MSPTAAAAAPAILWVDGVGGFLVLRGPAVTLGPAFCEQPPDVPILADVSRNHATIRREGEGYSLCAERATMVNLAPVQRTLLKSGDRVTLGASCQLLFSQPEPLSATARLTIVSGHRPLPGYVIKRGISKGGFGEVYFGLTDGGKEVALKRLIRDQDIELRGIRQCLNLKHPHLVHLYDLKTDDRGDHWLVMEYIRGETLHSLLQKHPNGLPHDLIRPWFQQLAAAVHSLHEQGIVHRDLKPANVFLEAGLVKVGDYGLCKFIGGSQHRAQSQNVGTVHYMAPEIGKGDYSRPIDVYAAGIVLYEMITGRVPFDGETTGEILFKHLSANPDLSKTGPFAPILAKALAKDPTQRYASMAEMAHRVAETDSLASPAPVVLAIAPRPVVARLAPRVGDPLSRSLTLAGVTAAVLTAIWAEAVLGGNWQRIAPAFVLATLGSWGVMSFSRWWRKRADDSLPRRLQLGLFGVALGFLAVWLQGYSIFVLDGAGDWHIPRMEVGTRGYLAYFGLMFASIRWWHMAGPLRQTRFSWRSMFAVGFLACILLFLLSAEERHLGFATMIITAAAVQLASPRREPEPAPKKRLRLG